jgi:uncharacterized protein (TIGR01777 family)
MSAARAVLVTGATGLVGRRLVASLRAADRAVRIVSRRSASASFDAGVEVTSWNGCDLPREAVSGAGAIVHLAGEPIFGGRLTAASRVDSTASIATSLSALPESERPACLVCASAVGYYGPHGGAELDETAAPGGDFLAQVCVDWERAARAAASAGTRVVSLRFGVVLAREGGALPQMAIPFRLALGGRLGDGRQWFPWIHVDDAVALVATALGDPRWSGAVNAVSPGIVTNGDLTRALGRVLHRPTVLSVPAAALRLALGELAGQLLGSRRVVPRAARERGFRFAYPDLEPALREALVQ